jgi:hypothetical protein
MLTGMAVSPSAHALAGERMEAHVDPAETLRYE